MESEVPATFTASASGMAALPRRTFCRLLTDCLPLSLTSSANASVPLSLSSSVRSTGASGAAVDALTDLLPGPARVACTAASRLQPPD